MMMFPVQNSNSSMQMPMTMPMTASTKEGDKSNSQQPYVYMIPVCFADPTKLKDMKIQNMENMPNMPFPYFPYPMSVPQSQENK